ncbi:Cytochrome bo(3) ubiquinol oxidase subunit 4 [compost metagenome]
MILTVIPFGLVMYPTLPKSITLLIVLAFAIVQVLVHLVYFLHLDRSAAQRNNVIAFVFAAIVIVLLVGLSLWIMFSIHTFMMAK